jgi:hypothetical protein
LNVLLHGQVSIIILAAFTFSYLAVCKNRLFLGGIVLGLVLFKPQVVIPFVAFYLLQRQIRLVLGFIVGALLPLLLNLIVVGVQGMAAHISLISFINRQVSSDAARVQFATYPESMINLRGVAYAFIGEIVHERVLIILIISISGGLVLYFGRRKYDNSEARFVAALCVSMAVSYHLLNHDLMLLIIPGLFLLGRCSTEDRALVAASALVIFSLSYLLLSAFAEVSYLALIYPLLVYGCTREAAAQRILVEG